MPYLAVQEIETIAAQIETMDPKFIPVETQMAQLQMANTMAQTDAIQNPPQTTEEFVEILDGIQKHLVHFKTDQIFRKIGDALSFPLFPT